MSRNSLGRMWQERKIHGQETEFVKNFFVHSKVRLVKNCNKMLENVKEYPCGLKSVLMSDETDMHVSSLLTPWSTVLLQKLTSFQLV